MEFYALIGPEGWRGGAVDGIEICSSFARCCDACMEREVQHKVNGEMQTDIQYYHRIVGVVLVSTDFPIPLGVRFQKNGEAEVSCALALLQDLVGQLGRRFLDVLVGYALYLQAPFVKEVEGVGRQNGSPRTPSPRHGQRKRRSSNERQDGDVATEHQLLRHQFRTRLDLAAVHSSVQSQPLANRCGSVSDHHHRLSPQTPRSPPNYGPGGADDDSFSGLYLVIGLLPPPSPQPCPPKMRDLS